MRGLITPLLVLGLCTYSYSQDIAVLRGSERIPAIKKGDNIWHMRMEDEDYYLIQRTVVDGLTKKIDLLESDITRYEKVVVAWDTLGQKYQDYERAANKHIQVQNELVIKADSLYTGYKSLYSDFKRFVGFSTLSVVGGVGFVDGPGDNWKPAGAVGIGCHNWITQYQFGDGYRGLLLAYRWPLRF